MLQMLHIQILYFCSTNLNLINENILIYALNTILCLYWKMEKMKKVLLINTEYRDEVEECR